METFAKISAIVMLSCAFIFMIATGVGVFCGADNDNVSQVDTKLNDMQVQVDSLRIEADRRTERIEALEIALRAHVAMGHGKTGATESKR